MLMATSAATGGRRGHARPRVAAFDALRGFTILSMCAFHACYDLAYIYGFDMGWFTSGAVQDVWRDSISWTFLLLAGWMTSLSHNNLRRACVYGLAAFAVFAATSIAAVDAPINFGILFCMAASTLLWAGIEAAIKRRGAPFGAAVALAPALACILLFAASYGVPRELYGFSGLEWLGFPSAGFSSGDYYPMIPFTFMYLAGAFASRAWAGSGRRYPAWMMRDPCPPLSVVGRHSLLIYLAHQPVVLVLIEACRLLPVR